jgi:hypothetical protein
MWRLDRARLALYTLAGIGASALVAWMALAVVDREGTAPELLEKVEAADAAVDTARPRGKDKRKIDDSERAEVIARAAVWRAPGVPIARAALRGDREDQVTCRFKVTQLGGTTPKFDCVLDSGEEIRIKYGNGPEVPAEAAATRLLHALGFGADQITLVRTLRCYGCPKEPFSVMKAVDITQAEALYKKIVDFDEYEDFQWVALERKFDARPIETDALEGWSFFELDTIDPRRGGAPRAHVDAIRLLSVLLAHWDNKSENQRIVCLSQEWPDDAPCPQPFLLLQDVGATFGPPKFDLDAWAQVPMWENRAACTVSMRNLPFEGATFGQVTITESGRRFIGGLLAQLSDAQLTELFTHARFAEKRGFFTPSSDVASWVRVFKNKVKEITAGPACPSA